MMGLLTSVRLVFGVAGQLLVDIARWLFSDCRRLAIFLLIVLCLWLLGQAKHNGKLAESRRVQAAGWHAKFRDQKSEMLKFIDLVRAARKEAARKDRENIARVDREWSLQLHEVNNGYRADLAAARAELARRLRDARQGTGTTSAAGGERATAMPAIPTLSAGPVRAGEAAIVDGADLDVCTANTVTLEHLRDAWKRAASIDVNGQR